MSFNEIYEEFIYKRSYSRWIDKEKRRENFEDSYNRYLNFFIERVPKKYQKEFKEAAELILRLDIVPSMRAFWTAGNALKKDNICGYNCSYTTIDSLKSFSELMYILMNGTGVGFSVERQYVNQLPIISENIKESDEQIVFKDSKKGWAEGYYKFIKSIYEGKVLKYDLSKLRPKGARLKTFGGRSSGPEVLQQLLEFTKSIIIANSGRKLSSINCYDICCYIMSVVEAGGSRRSAGISLSNLSDDRMATAKFGGFWNSNPQRRFTNNSTAYTERPDSRRFLNEWIKLIESGSGERGIFNREGAKLSAAKSGRREINYDFGINPCGEIILRPKSFCNLSEIIIRPEDTLIDLKRKVRAATIIGCVQSTLTDFGFISRQWKNNCEEERLLGVSLSGAMDHPILNSVSRESKSWLHEMKEEAIETAEIWSKNLNINMPTAITCCKPSGTVSQLVNCASGIHPRFAEYYIRRIRSAKTDPITKFLIDKGLNYSPEVNQTLDETNTFVFDFPIKSPKTSITKDNITALQQLEYWKMFKDYWCEHNPSTTIYVKDSEWIEVGAWIYKNWNSICGLSFLPYDTGVYQLAPYEEIDEDTYNLLKSKFPEKIDFNELNKYEDTDNTEGSKEYACVGGACEII